MLCHSKEFYLALKRPDALGGGAELCRQGHVFVLKLSYHVHELVGCLDKGLDKGLTRGLSRDLSRGTVQGFSLLKIWGDFKDAVFIAELAGHKHSGELAGFDKPPDCPGRYPQFFGRPGYGQSFR